ncbi:hypothetical protein WJX79_000947 [Trebouxia sp. C0005]
MHFAFKVMTLLAIGLLSAEDCLARLVPSSTTPYTYSGSQQYTTIAASLCSLTTSDHVVCYSTADALTVSTTLETYAQNWADEGQFVHSYGAYGENLAEGDGNGWTSAADAASSAVDLWYNEVTLYDYSNAVFSSATGHFTQLVWVASTQIGFGAYLTSSGEWLIVAEFDPPGNVEGEFAANVLQS